MLLSLAALAAVGAPMDACHPAKVDDALEDAERTAPFVLVTAGEGQFRIAGQDFIHPRQWRSGDDLQICSQPRPADWVKIKDIWRGELPAAERLHKGSDPKAGAALAVFPLP